MLLVVLAENESLLSESKNKQFHDRNSAKVWLRRLLHAEETINWRKRRGAPATVVARRTYTVSLLLFLQEILVSDRHWALIVFRSILRQLNHTITPVYTMQGAERPRTMEVAPLQLRLSFTSGTPVTLQSLDRAFWKILPGINSILISCRLFF